MPKLPENVVMYPGETDQEFQPSVILDAAHSADLKYVLVLGWQENDELYVAGSSVNLPDRLWIIECYKSIMMAPTIVEDDE